MSAPRLTSNLEDHTLSAVRDCLLNIFESYSPYWRLFLNLPLLNALFVVYQVNITVFNIIISCRFMYFYLAREVRRKLWISKVYCSNHNSKKYILKSFPLIRLSLLTCLFIQVLFIVSIFSFPCLRITFPTHFVFLEVIFGEDLRNASLLE